MANRTKMPTDLTQHAKAIVDLASGERDPDEKDEDELLVDVGRRAS
jgi:uncharacterized protein YifE (UPF0438 family)